jgi:hypothetical protein
LAGDELTLTGKLLFLNKSAMQVEHNLSLSGGTKTKYYLSLGYNTQEGVAL